MARNKKRTLLLLFVLCVSLTIGVSAQKRTKSPPTRAADSRLKAPPNRAFNHRFTIDVNYDKFEDRTKVQLRLPVNEVESVHFAYFFPGQKQTASPSEIIFLFFKDNNREFLLPVNDFVILTDRDRMRVKMVESTDLVMDGKNPYIAKLDYSKFLRMANARRLDVKIGDFEISFDDESLEALKDLASRTSPSYRPTKAEREAGSVDQAVTKEADRLRRLTLETKIAIREVLLAAKAAMIICLGTDADDVKQAATGAASRVYVDNKSVFTGDTAELTDEVMKALVRSDILRSVRNGTIDSRQFNTREIIDHYDLSGIPETQRPKAILQIGDRYLDMVLRIAREAGIIE